MRKQAASGNKRPRRADFAYPYLEPSVALKTRVEETADVASYANKLSPDEKAWMNQFMKEYVNADTSKPVFHTTAAEKKICNDKNNARNRCWYTDEQANNRLNLVESDAEMERLLHGQENESYEDEREEEIEEN